MEIPLAKWASEEVEGKRKKSNGLLKICITKIILYDSKLSAS